MAIVRRRVTPGLVDLTTSINSARAEALLESADSTHFHVDASEQTVTAANATDLPSAVALVNQEKAVYEYHRKDAGVVSPVAHKTLDATNVESVANANPNAGDGGLAGAIALANDIKTQFNAHLTQSTVHYNNDATNTVAASNATDLASLETLVNAIKTALNAHMASAPSGKSLRLVAA